MAEISSKTVKFAPSLLSADWSRAGEQIAELKAAGCDWLHFDAMDGHFVPNLTLGPMFLKALRPHSDLHFDAHLMLRNAGDRVEDFLEAGANSISVHAEENPHLHRVLTQIQDGGAMAGAVLNPATPVGALECVLPLVDYVLVMSVNPGFGGQKFLPFTLQKVEELARRREREGLGFQIQIDGGVSAHNIREVVAAGVDIVVAGSAIFAPGQSLRQNVAAMRAAMG